MGKEGKEGKKDKKDKGKKDKDKGKKDKKGVMAPSYNQPGAYPPQGGFQGGYPPPPGGGSGYPPQGNPYPMQGYPGGAGGGGYPPQGTPYQGYSQAARAAYTKKGKKDKKGKKEKKGKKPKNKEEKKKWKQEKKQKKFAHKAEVASTINYAQPAPELTQHIEEKKKQLAKTPAEEWGNAGKAEGLEIWRIEQFAVVPVPKESHGCFYSGDSYIVLRTYKVGNAFRWDLHFWLGEHTTQDESGTAAYKTVELDEYLGGSPVQHREIQECESQLFLSYFTPSIQILSGGVETGFNQVKPEEYRPRLLHLKGTKTVRVSEVSLTSDSLNSGDVFALDAGLSIFLWNGSKSSIGEKRKGADLAQSLKSHRKGKPQVFVLDEGDESAEFWDILGGKGVISSAEEGGDDFQAEKMAHHAKCLLRLSDASGQMSFQEVSRGPAVNKSQLDSNDVFILDSGFEVFVWIGKGSSKTEKKMSMNYAQQYLFMYQRPPFLPLTRVMEGGENPTFDAAFTS